MTYTVGLRTTSFFAQGATTLVNETFVKLLSGGEQEDAAIVPQIPLPSIGSNSQHRIATDQTDVVDLEESNNDAVLRELAWDVLDKSDALDGLARTIAEGSEGDRGEIDLPQWDEVLAGLSLRLSLT